MNIQDMIKKMPPEMQVLANQYLSILLQCADDEFESVINLFLSNQTIAAYEFVFRHMTPEERLAAMQNTNDRMKALKGKSLSIDATLKAIGKEFLQVGWALLLVFLRSKADLPELNT